MQVTQYNINAWLKGINGFGLLPCNQIYTATMTASTHETVTVPSGSALGAVNSSQTGRYVAIFSYKAATDFWVAFNGQTAAVPAGASFGASTSELNPNARVVNAGSVIDVISAAGGYISISFYAIQEG